MVLEHFTFYYYSMYFSHLAIFNILLLNPKKSLDFISILADFTLYIVKSVDFLNICKISSEIFNICEPNIIQIVYFLVLEDSGGLYLFGIICLVVSLLNSPGESFHLFLFYFYHIVQLSINLDLYLFFLIFVQNVISL